jgi:hypothetical protein
MTTWICKGPLVALALTALAACEGGQGAGLLDGLGTTIGPKERAFSQVNMAGGAVILKAPRGFCIDGHSLKQRFALMARCDKLGAPAAAAGAAPLGVITVSLSKAVPNTGLPDPTVTATALGLSNVSDLSGDDTTVIFRATGPAPTEDLDEKHWRATALVNGQILGLALYGAKDGQEVSDEGREILTSVIERTRTAN